MYTEWNLDFTARHSLGPFAAAKLLFPFLGGDGWLWRCAQSLNWFLWQALRHELLLAGAAHLVPGLRSMPALTSAGRAAHATALLGVYADSHGWTDASMPAPRAAIPYDAMPHPDALVGDWVDWFEQQFEHPPFVNAVESDANAQHLLARGLYDHLGEQMPAIPQGRHLHTITFTSARLKATAHPTLADALATRTMIVDAPLDLRRVERVIFAFHGLSMAPATMAALLSPWAITRNFPEAIIYVDLTCAPIHPHCIMGVDGSSTVLGDVRGYLEHDMWSVLDARWPVWRALPRYAYGFSAGGHAALHLRANYVAVGVHNPMDCEMVAALSSYESVRVSIGIALRPLEVSPWYDEDATIALLSSPCDSLLTIPAVTSNVIACLGDADYSTHAELRATDATIINYAGTHQSRLGWCARSVLRASGVFVADTPAPPHADIYLALWCSLHVGCVLLVALWPFAIQSRRRTHSDEHPKGLKAALASPTTLFRRKSSSFRMRFSDEKKRGSTNSPRRKNRRISTSSDLQHEHVGKRVVLDNVGFTCPAMRDSPARTLLEPTTMTLHAGQVGLIVGPSGAGKSTLLNAIANPACRTSGTVLWLSADGKAIENISNQFVSIVPMAAAPIHRLTTLEQIQLFVRCHYAHASSFEVAVRVNQWLCDFGLDAARNVRTEWLSHGQQRRLHIMCHLAAEYHVYLLDEPTDGLDAATALGLMEMLNMYAAKYGVVMMAVLHQPRPKIVTLCATITVLVAGHVVYHGKQGALMSIVPVGRRRSQTFFSKAQGIFSEPQLVTTPASSPLDMVLDVTQKMDSHAAAQIAETYRRSWRAQLHLRIARKMPAPMKAPRKAPWSVHEHVLRAAAMSSVLHTVILQTMWSLLRVTATYLVAGLFLGTIGWNVFPTGIKALPLLLALINVPAAADYMGVLIFKDGSMANACRCLGIAELAPYAFVWAYLLPLRITALALTVCTTLAMLGVPCVAWPAIIVAVCAHKCLFDTIAMLALRWAGPQMSTIIGSFTIGIGGLLSGFVFDPRVTPLMDVLHMINPFAPTLQLAMWSMLGPYDWEIGCVDDVCAQADRDAVHEIIYIRPWDTTGFGAVCYPLALSVVLWYAVEAIATTVLSCAKCVTCAFQILIKQCSPAPGRCAQGEAGLLWSWPADKLSRRGSASGKHTTTTTTVMMTTTTTTTTTITAELLQHHGCTSGNAPGESVLVVV